VFNINTDIRRHLCRQQCTSSSCWHSNPYCVSFCSSCCLM